MVGSDDQSLREAVFAIARARLELLHAAGLLRNDVPAGPEQMRIEKIVSRTIEALSFVGRIDG